METGRSGVVLHYIRVRSQPGTHEKTLWPWLDPGPGLKIAPIPEFATKSGSTVPQHRILPIPEVPVLEMPPILEQRKCRQSLSLPQNQTTKLHQTQTTPENSVPPSQEILFKVRSLFSLLLFLTGGFFFLGWGLLCCLTFSLEQSPALTTFSWVEWSRSEL